jgi:hypothetical protein
MTDRLSTQTVLELAYWNIRQVMENANDCLGSHNELWGFLNELYEDIERMEAILDIRNPMVKQ